MHHPFRALVPAIVAVAILALSMLAADGHRAVASVPPTMSYQGSLRDLGGAVPPDGPYAFVFRLYNVPSGGAALWQESQTLPVTGGLFHAILGAVTPLNLPFDAQYWLETTVGGDILSPRVVLTASPYAQRAAIADAVAGGGGGGIGGSGTAGYLSKFTGATTIGNSLVFDSGSRVGIGTTTPSARMCVEQNGTYDDLLSLRSDALAQFSLHTTEADGGSALYFRHGGGDGNVTSYLLEDQSGLRIIRQAAAGGIVLGSPSADGYFGGAVTAVYSGYEIGDVPAIHGESVPADYWGIGGRFEGGFIGGLGQVTPTGSADYYGLVGRAEGGMGIDIGVYGTALGEATNYGVYGTAYGGNANYAGFFSGDAHVTGNLTVAGTKSFRIDHPLDPANRYLNHFCVESAEVLNTYSGNVVLDAGGEATVELPGWFGAINRDPRYQLTCVGGYAQVYIAEEISGRGFRIAGGTPGLKVSWEVTAVRNDPAVLRNQMPVEQEKPAAERGRYLHPELYGAAATEGIGAPNPRPKAASPAR